MSVVGAPRPVRRPADPPADRKHRPLRGDIQGLRALAVGLVLVYHLLPNRLTGGFVGVDVFFVISGFLIIGLLVGEIRRTGRISLLDFYARRVRRLLPAATAVLLAVVGATVLLLPSPRWPTIMDQVIASALNVQNWFLAAGAADYANATAAASPVQHYWSLAVEEQFYLFIPLVLLLSVLLARGRHPIRIAFVSVAVVTAASLAYSILVTTSPPAGAYFVTPTRIWELGLGGLTATAVHRLRMNLPVRLLLGWGGLAAVLVSAATFSTGMAFPGWIALLPTVGTMAMLMAGSRSADERPHVTELATPLGMQPLRYLGDISYSLYLWHWPVIVFTLEWLGRDRFTGTQVLVVAAAALLLASLSKHLVEDPLRSPRKPRGRRVSATSARPRRRFAYLMAAALVATSVAAAMWPGTVARQRLAALYSAPITLDAPHPGAMALDPDTPAPVPPGVAPVPDPAVADQDMAKVWQDGCAVYDLAKRSATSDECTFGDPTAPKLMVLVGDSHMTMFSTALISFATSGKEWRVRLLVQDGCGFGDLPPDKAGYPLKVCADKAYELQPVLTALKPDLVVTSGFSLGAEVIDGSYTWPQWDRVVSGYQRLLRPLADAGIPIAAIRDVPHMTANTPRCLLQNPTDPTRCETSRAAALGSQDDPLVAAVRDLPGARVADLTNWLCTEDVCPAVVGNVVVYRDNHLTDSYVRTLIGPLIAQLGLR